MTNRTQCPNCAAIFVISDQLYLKSKGRVICGTCREPFHPTFLADETATSIGDNSHQGDDLREDLSEDLGEDYFHSETASIFAEPLSETTLLQISNELQDDELEKLPSFPDYDFSFDDNIHSELSIDMDSDDIDANDKILHAGGNQVIQSTRSEVPTNETGLPQAELEFPERPSSAIDDDAIQKNQSRHQAAQTQDQQLITEVTQLIDDKLLNESPPAISTETQQPDQGEPFEEKPFTLDTKPNALRRWLIMPLIGLLALLLLASLIYQLWHRQALSWLENQNSTKVVAQLLNPIAEPIVGKLLEKFDATLPIRRDLNKLQLLSARTEAHPSRSSTILLRVSLINHSKISQPFPWLELSLTDENGHLVSRRALSPDKYLYHNQLENLIGPNELKRVAIEFLSFPKQAHGYELKMLNK